MKEKRKVRVHCFFSLKGGAGKSTLAVAASSLIAKSPDRRCIVVELDLFCPSLADGLQLQAPRVEVDDSGLLLLRKEPTGAFYTVEETEKLVVERGKTPQRCLPPPFLNDALKYRGQGNPPSECRLDSLLWRDGSLSSSRYLPASPLSDDRNLTVAWVTREVWVWSLRFAWVLHTLVEQTDVTDVVLDCPTGLSGYTHCVLSLLADLEGVDVVFPEGYPPMRETISWKINPVLVLTQDRGDLLVSLDAFNRLVQWIPNLLLVMNKVTTAEQGKLKNTIVQQARDRLGAENFDEGALKDRLVFLTERPRTLGRLFCIDRVQAQPDEKGAQPILDLPAHTTLIKTLANKLQLGLERDSASGWLTSTATVTAYRPNTPKHPSESN